MRPLTTSQCRELADSLPDVPEYTISIHALRTGRCQVICAGSPNDPAAVVIDPALTAGELLAWGNDPETIAEAVGTFKQWTCVEVAPRISDDVKRALEARLGESFTRVQDVYHTLQKPVAPRPHPAVRLLAGEADAALYARCAPAFNDHPEEAYRTVLEGPVAAAIVDGQVVGAVEANVRTPRHANMCAEFLAAYRKQGMCTAAAALAAQAIQEMGLMPVWSAAHDNGASLRVAQKVGYLEVGHWIYLVRRKT
jgi:hypothetical protein